MRLFLLALMAIGLGLAACGDDDPPAAGGGGAPAVLSVPEALEADTAEPVRVRGWLWSDGAKTLLCDAIAESYPPQCPGPSLVVEGLDIGRITDVQSANGITWAERVELLGTLDGKTFSVLEY